MEGPPNQQYCLRWNNHSTNLQSEFHELLQKEAFTDVVLDVGHDSSSVSFKCHKIVLAACSKYFKNILIQNPSAELVMLPEVDAWAMKAILEYMYQGEVCVLQDRISDLLKVAKMLQVKGLTDDEPQTPREQTPSPPPATSSTDRNPAHSTSPYYPFGTSPSSLNSAYMSGWNHLSSLSLAAESVLNPLLGRRSTTLFPGAFDLNEGGQNREPTILRTALGQGLADSSQGLSSAVDDLDLGLNGHSAFTADLDSGKSQKRKKSMDGGQPRKSSGKNYKMYSKEQMEAAIERVRGGDCALSVAADMKIPSRTLYDKVKKLGLKTNKHGRRSRKNSGAHFPHGFGGNHNGAIYRRMSDPDAASIALLEMSQGQGRQSSENSDNSRQSPCLEDERQLQMDVDAAEDQKPEVQEDNDVQDLSVQRTNVIVSPARNDVVSPARNDIKEENNDLPKD